MSLLDDVSIVVTPNGYKAGELYAVVPVPTEGAELVTNGDFATDSDWNKDTGWSVGGGVASSNGTSGAKLYQNVGIAASKLYKFTIEVKTLTSGNIDLYYYNGSYQTIALNLGLGTHNLRFSTSGTPNGSIYVNSSSFTGTVSNISVKESTRNDLARVDYTGSTSSLLAEPQRTNLVTYSEDFSNAFWNLGNSSLASGFTSPDGTTNSYKLIEDTSTGSHSVYSDNVTVTVGSSYTYSLYVKKGERSNIRLDGGYRLSLDATFNLNTLVVTGNGTIETLSNGWYRLTATGVGEISTGATNVYTYLLDDSGTQSYTGNGNSGLYIWGGQLEQGSYATSYIPTSGSTVTRVQDQYSKTGISDLINSAEGVLFLEVAYLTQTSPTVKEISLNDGTNSNRVALRLNTATNQIRAIVRVGGSNQFTVQNTISNVTNYNKIALKYKENDFALWVNGVELDVNTSGSIPSGLNQLDFDEGNGSSAFCGKVKQLQVFKTALTDSELIALTT